MVFPDIHPLKPIHLLIVTKKHIPDLQSLKGDDLSLLAEIIQVAQQIAKKKNILDGYRLLTNNGRGSGQTIFHLHFHLIGGDVLGPMA